jgi:hypothetical protein
MAKRYRSQDKLSAPPAIQPAAQGGDRYYQTNQRQPTLNPIYDFAPLSRELLQIVSEDMAGAGAAQIAEGEAAANLDATGKAFAQLVRDGVIPEAASPFFQRGFAQARGRKVVGEYRTRLMQRVNEVTALTGADGLPSKPVDPSAILTEEWANLADNPALQNFFGRQSASQLKAEVDNEFLQEAGRARATADEQAHKSLLANEVASRVSQLQLKDEVQPSDLEGLTAYITETYVKQGIVDPRGVAWSGIELALKNVANTAGPDEALRMTDLIADLKVGDLAIGDDARVGVQLADLKATFMRQAENDEYDERQRRNSDRADAILRGQQMFLPDLLKAYQNNESVVAVRDRLAEQIRTTGGFGEFTAHVVEDLFAKADGYKRGVDSDQATVDQLNKLIARGQIPEAQALWNAAVDGDLLHGEDIARFDAAIERENAVTPELQSSPSYQETVGLIRSAGSLDGFAPEVQSAEEEVRRQMEEEYTGKRVALMKSLVGDNQKDSKLSAFDQEQKAIARARIQEREKAIRAAKKTADEKVAQAHMRHTDASDAINAAYADGTYTNEQFQQAMALNDRATDRSRWFGGFDVSQALNSIQTEIESNADLLDESRARLSSSFTRLFQDKWHAALDEKLPKTEPRYVDLTVRTITQDVTDEVMSQLGAGVRMEMDKAAKQGKSMFDAAKIQEGTEEGAKRAAAWATEDKAVSAYTPNSPAMQSKMHPALPSALAEAYSQVLRGSGEEAKVSRGFLSSWNVSAPEKLQDQIGSSVFELLDNEELPPADRDAAVTAAVSLYGLTADDVLNGSMIVRRSEKVREFAKAEAKRERAAARSGSIRNLVGSGANRKLMQENYVNNIELQVKAFEDKWLREEPIDLSKAPIDAYTTPLWRSIPEMAEFATARPADMAALLKRFGIPEDDHSVQKFIDLQKAAITRTYR